MELEFYKLFKVTDFIYLFNLSCNDLISLASEIPLTSKEYARILPNGMEDQPPTTVESLASIQRDHTDQSRV